MIKKIVMMMGFAFVFALANVAYAGSWNPCNPCSMKKNPCAMNPCDMKSMQHNPCSMNPCDMKKMKHNPCSMNPCDMKKMKHNPCAMNPCAADVKKKIRSDKFKNFQEAAAAGKKLWQDETLGKSGLACLSCHAGYENLNLEKRQNYPHYVAMPDDVVTLDQMINFCMINPMEGQQIEPNSKDMTAMAAYFRAYRMQYLKGQ